MRLSDLLKKMTQALRSQCTPQHPSPARKQFRPCLEALEDRQVMSGYGYTVSGDTLTVRGDSRPDKVEISDNGGTGSHNIRLTLNGQSTEFAEHIRQITVLTGKGDDSVSYNLTGDLLPGRHGGINARLFNADLGRGVDHFAANILGDLQSQFAPGGKYLLGTSSLSINVEGGWGVDTVTVYAGHLGGDSVNIGKWSSLVVNLGGGHNRDNIYMYYSGDNDGYLSLNGTGGYGNDTVYAYITLEAGSKGAMDTIIAGCGGDDTLTCNIYNNGQAQVWRAWVWGGSGHDKLYGTSNVNFIA